MYSNLSGLDQPGCFTLIPTAEGWQRTNSGEPVSTQTSCCYSAVASDWGLITEPSHVSSSFGYSEWTERLVWFAISLAGIYEKKQRHADRTQHACFTWSAWVMFSLHLGCFLPHRRQIIHHATFGNFVIWLNVMSSRCYFNLTQLPGIRKAGGVMDLPPC